MTKTGLKAMIDRFLGRREAARADGGDHTPPVADSVPPAVAADVQDDDAAAAARVAQFDLGEVVRHRHFPFRGVIFDVDPEFANTEEWWQAIPEAIRPRKDQPFYHLLAENDEASYVAYVSQQNLVRDDSGQPVNHPAVTQLFETDASGRYRLKRQHAN
jgi:heat shock protein HspQ